jgi:hypothetical protein
MTTTASAGPTLDWLGRVPSLAIPVYQRDYRWTPATCERLLDDAWAAAQRSPGETHFIGSLLVKPDDAGGLTLVDGQQRITTLMLLVAAIREHASASIDHADIADAANDVLRAPSPSDAIRLTTHERFHGLLSALLTHGLSAAEATGNPFVDNYEFLLERTADRWPEVWRGLQRLEHVTISLGEQSNAQQIFESLNSTGAPLSDDELIHNYVHMGRTFTEQTEIENTTWVPIEEATQGATREFWRDYLVLTGDQVADFTGDFGIYRVFKERFPDPIADVTAERRAEWLRLAEAYSTILRPTTESDPAIAAQLRLLQTFAGTARPFTLALYDDYRRGRITSETLTGRLEQLQTMLIRRAAVGLATQLPMVGVMCREWQTRGHEAFDGMVQRTPEDPHVRLTLTHSKLPYAGYVLQRLQGVEPENELYLQIEHIHPQNPADGWSGDGSSTWAAHSTDEQARYRALLDTIGNLTLLEAPLNQGAGNRSFLDKRDYYRRSLVRPTKMLADLTSWDLAAIESRTRALVEEFVRAWPRPGGSAMTEGDELIRVVDLATPALRGYPKVFEHAEFRGALWGDVTTSKQLLVRLVNELCRLDRGRLAESENGRLIVATRVPHKSYERLANGEWLYTGWHHQYLLETAQTLATEFDLQDELRVKLISLEEGPAGA